MIASLKGSDSRLKGLGSVAAWLLISDTVVLEVEVKAEAEKAVPSRDPGRAVPWAELFLDYRPTSG